MRRMMIGMLLAGVGLIGHAMALGADEAKPGNKPDTPPTTAGKPANATGTPAPKPAHPGPKPGDKGGLKGSSDVLFFATQAAAEEAIEASSGDERDFQATVSRLMRTKQASYTPEYTTVEIKSVGPKTFEVVIDDGNQKGKSGFVYNKAFIDAQAMAAERARFQQRLQQQARMYAQQQQRAMQNQQRAMQHHHGRR